MIVLHYTPSAIFFTCPSTSLFSRYNAFSYFTLKELNVYLFLYTHTAKQLRRNHFPVRKLDVPKMSSCDSLCSSIVIGESGTDQRTGAPCWAVPTSPKQIGKIKNYRNEKIDTGQDTYCEIFPISIGCCL